MSTVEEITGAVKRLPKKDLARFPEMVHCIRCGDHFLWDTDTPEGDRIGETLDDWSIPEINHPLTKGNIRKFRHLLLTGENTFVRADLKASA